MDISNELKNKIYETEIKYMNIFTEKEEKRTKKIKAKKLRKILMDEKHSERSDIIPNFSIKDINLILNKKNKKIKVDMYLISTTDNRKKMKYPRVIMERFGLMNIWGRGTFDHLLTLVHFLIKMGDIDGLKYLFEDIPKNKMYDLVNATHYSNHSGNSLHAAVRSHHIGCKCVGSFKMCKREYPHVKNQDKIIKLLLSYGADINKKNYYDKTPYEWSIDSEILSSDPSPQISHLVNPLENI